MAEQSRHEEVFNSILHAIGAMASGIGLVLLIWGETDPWRLFSFCLFAGSMIILYSSSALYHAVSGSAKHIIKKIDQLSIYLLIASTYSPFTLILLPDKLGWTVFITVWLLALIGIVYDLIPRSSNHRVVPVTIYLLMGWMALVMAGPLLDKLSVDGFIWLVTGGLFYTSGLFFYALDERVRFFHAIWHLFVLAGSFFHFLVIYRFIAQT